MTNAAAEEAGRAAQAGGGATEFLAQVLRTRRSLYWLEE